MLKNPHIIRKESPVLWLPFVSELAKVIYLAWDLGSRSYIALHFRAKVVKKKNISSELDLSQEKEAYSKNDENNLLLVKNS